jgi:hypothetical protein
MPFSLEEQLRLLGPPQFEELCAQLAKREFPQSRHVEGAGGDKGLDIFEGDLDPTNRIDTESKLRVWQVKFFRNGVKRKQREKTEASLQRVLVHKPEFWTLCVPVNLDTEAHKWFQTLKLQHESLTLDVWQADDIVQKIRADKSLLTAYFLPPAYSISDDILNRILSRLDDFSSVPDLLERAYQSLKIRAKSGIDFYNGSVADWRDIAQSFDAPREQFGYLWRAVSESANHHTGRIPFVLITGRSADGKSTMLMRLAAELVNQGHSLVFFQKDDRFVLHAEQFLEVPKNTVVFICLDKVARFEPAVLRGFLERLYRECVPAVVVAAAVQSMWQALNLDLTNIADVSELSIQRLSDEDIEAILDKLSADPKFAEQYLGELAHLSREEQIARFERKADRQLLVALIEAKHNRAFEAYAWGELEELERRFGSDIQLACTYVSAVYRFDLPLPKLLLQRLMPTVRLDDTILRRTQGVLTELAFPVSGVIMRHALIAEIIFRRVAADTEKATRWYAEIIEAVKPSLGEDRFLCHVFKGL